MLANGGRIRGLLLTFGDLHPGTCASPSTAIPVVHVTVGASHPVTHNFIDEDQVLNDHGVDGATCPALFSNGCEGLPWQEVHEGQATGN